MTQHVLAEINETLKGIHQELKKMNEPPKAFQPTQTTAKDKRRKAFK
ncbi:hypothetical protein GLW20_01570 [Virgibacillus halodenitrificans]|nr:hypothetical protein [Virgibacillus halodenitrificans]